MPIYKDQTAARLILQTGVNFNLYDTTALRIYYEKPNGTTTGYWTATKLTGGELSGKIYVDFSSGIKFDVLGVWRLWAYVVFADSRVAQGDPASYKVIDSEALF